MTESAASEPIRAEALRTLAVAELTTIQYLLVSRPGRLAVRPQPSAFSRPRACL
jgi:hypothetical protein